MNLFKKVGKLFRRTIYCSRNTHWDMVYDSGLRDDISRAGTCSDCGYRTEGVAWSRVPNTEEFKPYKSHSNEDLNKLLKEATRKEILND